MRSHRPRQSVCHALGSAPGCSFVGMRSLVIGIAYPTIVSASIACWWMGSHPPVGSGDRSARKQQPAATGPGVALRSSGAWQADVCFHDYDKAMRPALTPVTVKVVGCLGGDVRRDR